MDIYVVLNHEGIIGISARLQGAELIRADFERQHGQLYGELRIENHELQDME